MAYGEFTKNHLINAILSFIPLNTAQHNWTPLNVLNGHYTLIVPVKSVKLFPVAIVIVSPGKKCVRTDRDNASHSNCIEKLTLISSVLPQWKCNTFHGFTFMILNIFVGKRDRDRERERVRLKLTRLILAFWKGGIWNCSFVTNQIA